MSYVQLGTQNPTNANNSNNTTAGSPGANGDGIDWPYDQNGQTPNFQIPWNSVPPPTTAQIEAIYKALINWLKNNTGSPAFYNGSIMLLQMTTDIGQHMGSYSQSDQAQLSSFLSNQISTGPNQMFLQMIIQIAAEACAVSQTSLKGGQDAAQKFLQELANATSGLTKYGEPFTGINDEASHDSGTIGQWCLSHWKIIYSGAGNPGVGTWVDDESANPNDNTINGPQPINFEQFVQDAQFALGTAITASTNPSVDGTINAYYETQIQELVAQFKGNPWALLAALMNLINQRDQDNGTAVNGYGGTLDQLKQANGIIQKMLGDISGTSPNMADFYSQLKQLKALVEKNPALSSVVGQLESDVGTINGQSVTFTTDINFDIASAGYYNFPPGTHFSVNGKQYVAPASGVVYISQPGHCLIPVGANSPVTFSFGQLAAMGDTTDIATQMGAWSSTVMSNFEDGVTGIQTLLNSPSAGIQQMIQNTTQIMQAEENFEKMAYDSIVNVNTQVMKLVQSVMG